MGNMNSWFSGKGDLWYTHLNVTATREWFCKCCRRTHQLMRPSEGKGMQVSSTFWRETGGDWILL